MSWSRQAGWVIRAVGMSVLLLRVFGTAADDEAEYAVFLGPGEEGVAGLAAVGLEVGDRGAVGGEHAEALARRHGAERAVGAQHRDGAGGAFHVEEGFAHSGILPPGARAGQAMRSGAYLMAAVAVE